MTSGTSNSAAPDNTALVFRIRDLNKEIQENEKAVAGVKKSLNTLNSDFTAAKKASWTGRLVNFLMSSPRLNFLHELLSKFFASYHSAAENQKSLSNRIKVSETELSEKVNTLAASKFKISKLREESTAFDYVQPLFGTKEKYEQLPILEIDLKTMTTGTGYIDRLKPEHLGNHAIMRFNDRGRLGFAIKIAYPNESGKPSGQSYVQVYHQRYANIVGTWTESGSLFEFAHPHFISDGAVPEKSVEGFNALKDLLEKGCATFTSYLGITYDVVLDKRVSS